MSRWRALGRLWVLLACQAVAAAILSRARHTLASSAAPAPEAPIRPSDLTRGDAGRSGNDRSPGEQGDEEVDVVAGIRGYVVGLGSALLLTGLSFYVAGGGSLVWTPGIPIALVALAIAQMGVHLVFFLHITTSPDNTNNALALAFGVLIVFLVLAGSLWIMTNLNHNMMPMDQIMRMKR